METAALTRGSIPPQLVSLALPLIFGNILQQLYNTIDAMVIGRTRQKVKEGWAAANREKKRKK